MSLLTLDDIKAASTRLAGHIHTTPVRSSEWLNRNLGHQFYFKAENLQKIGAFKARGGYNTLAWLKERQQLPERVVAYSSGNHAQSVAWAAAQFGIKATILMPQQTSAIKIQATKAYGAQVVICQDRASAEAQAEQLANEGAYLLPPYDHDQVICGQGTVVLEALEQQPNIDAVFVPCGGGGLLSGSVIAAKGINSDIKVFGAEPITANDAAQSLSSGHIVKLAQSPDTIADGVCTLAISERTFSYLKQSDGILEIEESAILYWTQWLTHLLKVTIEPTSALGMAAACQWLATVDSPQKVLIVLSGGNIDHASRCKVWAEDHLGNVPTKMAANNLKSH
jgi:threonine dehydratase